MKRKILLLIFWFTMFGPALSQPQILGKADSLFDAGRYTAAWEQYDSLYQSGVSSEKMLLKMAYIKEGLGDYTSALYFLNQYYFLTSDKSVLNKMNELAAEESLSGYSLSDKDFVLTFLRKYQLHLQILLGTVVLLLTGFIYLSARKQQLPIGLPIVQIITVVLLLGVSNQWMEPTKAIIVEDTFLMTAPSAAAEVYSTAEKGHRVEVLGKRDVWVKVKWNGQELYIRESKLKEL